MPLYVQEESLTKFMEERIEAESCDPAEVLEQIEDTVLSTMHLDLQDRAPHGDLELFRKITNRELLAWCQAH